MWTPDHTHGFERRPETGGAKVKELWPSHVSYDFERLVPFNLLGYVLWEET